MPSKAWLRLRQSRKLAGDTENVGMPGKLVCGGVCQICTNRSGSSNGRGRSNTALTTLKMAVFAATPRPSVKIAFALNPGLFAPFRRLDQQGFQSVFIAS